MLFLDGSQGHPVPKQRWILKRPGLAARGAAARRARANRLTALPTAMSHPDSSVHAMGAANIIHSAVVTKRNSGVVSPKFAKTLDQHT